MAEKKKKTMDKVIGTMNLKENTIPFGWIQFGLRCLTYLISSAKPAMMNHYVMLQRDLIYTGIIRVKRMLGIVGTKKALPYAVKNVTVTKRNTLLKERL